MRSKKVTRYWCDYCNKASLSASAMTRHEKHCTMNPSRCCRVCTLINGGYSTDVAELMHLLPDATGYNNADFISDQLRSDFSSLLEAGMEKLREATDNCPACIMAALRQAKIAVPMVESFNFKDEMKRVFKEHNEEMAYYC